MTTLLFYFYALRRFLWSVDTVAVKISILTSHTVLEMRFLFLKTSASWVKCFLSCLKTEFPRKQTHPAKLVPTK